MAGLQTSHGGLAGWENHAGSLLLLARFTGQAWCLQSTHPALGDGAGYLWGSFRVLSMLGSQQGCWTSLRSSSPRLTPVVAQHRPLVPAWKIAQPSVLVSSLISSCFFCSALLMNTMFSEMRSGLIGRLLRGTCFPFSRHLAIARSNKKII